MQMNVSAYLLRMMKAYEVNSVFGVPGDYVLRFFKELEQEPDIQLFPYHHEPDLGFLADGAYRRDQHIVAVVVTYGVGGLLTINSISHAYNERIPVLIISGSPGNEERSYNMLVHHQSKSLQSQFNCFAEVCEKAFILDDPEKIPQQVHEAMEALKHKSRPVYLEITKDILHQFLQVPDSLPTGYHSDPQNLKEVVKRIAGRIERASLPVIVAGHEIQRLGLEKQLLDMVSQSGIPFFVTFDAPGIVENTADTPKHFCGTYYNGIFNEKDALIDMSTCVILLGNPPSDVHFTGYLNKTDNLIVAYDDKVSFSGPRGQTFDTIRLKDLLKELAGSDIRFEGTLPEAIKSDGYVTAPVQEDADAVTTDGITVLIEDAYTKNDMAVFVDTGQCLWSSMLLKERSRVHASYVYTTMGYALPASLGYEMATGKPSLVLVGDGAFQMSVNHLFSLRRYHLNPLIVLLNNGLWQTQNVFVRAEFNKLFEWDYEKICQSADIPWIRVETVGELKKALASYNGNTPLFVDAQLDESDMSRVVIEAGMRFKVYARDNISPWDQRISVDKEVWVDYTLRNTPYIQRRALLLDISQGAVGLSCSKGDVDDFVVGQKMLLKNLKSEPVNANIVYINPKENAVFVVAQFDEKQETAANLVENASPWLAEEHFSDGEFVFHEGDPGNKFYLITQGTAVISQKRNEQDRDISRLGPGQYFGELALLTEEPRLATVRAEGALSVKSIGKENFLQLYKGIPDLRSQLQRMQGFYQLPQDSQSDAVTMHTGAWDETGIESLTTVYQLSNGNHMVSTRAVGKPWFRVERTISMSASGTAKETTILLYQKDDEVKRTLRLRGNSIVGVHVKGQWPQLGLVHAAMLKEERIWPWQRNLFEAQGDLWLETPGEEPLGDDDIACHCLSIRFGDLRTVLQSGVHDGESLAATTGASRVCGCCKNRLDRLSEAK